jgi:hypothetical protein
MPLTIGQKLDLCMRRKMHVTDIQDPMVRALWWKRWEWKNAEIADDCGSASDLADLRENALHEVGIARAARTKIIKGLWDTRVINRLVASYAPVSTPAREMEHSL